jgi:hypothetical protein
VVNYWIKMEGWIFMLTLFLVSRVGEGDFSGSAEGSCIAGWGEAGWSGNTEISSWGEAGWALGEAGARSWGEAELPTAWSVKVSSAIGQWEINADEKWIEGEMVKVLPVDAASAGFEIATGCCALLWSHAKIKWSN